MKLRKLGSMALAAFMAVSLVACSSGGTASSAAGDSAANSESAAGDSAGKKRVCFVARASADKFLDRVFPFKKTGCKGFI